MYSLISYPKYVVFNISFFLKKQASTIIQTPRRMTVPNRQGELPRLPSLETILRAPIDPRGPKIPRLIHQQEAATSVRQDEESIKTEK